ncbi:MAG: AEC family transporter [Methanosphaera sp.]|uniref:AEC family transporter n=1 Tax=Methanosphaera sp. TaxID=2666342 RepID=UPI0025E529D1|nr:AEC family transporter [Methanosphaera sp.]MCI5866888.1 AEC family transporter [Methanosphaera sp.]MDD6534395.1 AEC family transporter [Methanosphaera sp.]MDY3955200.1 AEC family transporter [Methanosphaera sp.]
MPTPVEVILVPTLMIILGFFLKRIGMLKPQDSNTLSAIVLNVTLPAMVYINISTAKIQPDMMILPIASFILSIICMLIVGVFCKIRGYDKIKSWTLMIAAAMMNTGFIGYPITLNVFGNEGLLHAIFFDMVTPILFVMYGMMLVKEFGGDMHKVIKKGLEFVPLWAVVIGLVANVVHFQEGYVLHSTLNYLAGGTVPLIMISLGLTIDFRDVKKYLKDSLFISFIRLLLAPTIVFVVFSALGISGMVFNVAVLEAGMSTAMTALVLAITYNIDHKLMSSVILVDVVLSLITLTMWISILM